jgi:hypothetical protein
MDGISALIKRPLPEQALPRQSDFPARPSRSWEHFILVQRNASPSRSTVPFQGSHRATPVGALAATDDCPLGTQPAHRSMRSRSGSQSADQSTVLLIPRCRARVGATPGGVLTRVRALTPTDDCAPSGTQPAHRSTHGRRRPRETQPARRSRRIQVLRIHQLITQRPEPPKSRSTNQQPRRQGNHAVDQWTTRAPSLADNRSTTPTLDRPNNRGSRTPCAHLSTSPCQHATRHKSGQPTDPPGLRPPRAEDALRLTQAPRNPPGGPATQPHSHTATQSQERPDREPATQSRERPNREPPAKPHERPRTHSPTHTTNQPHTHPSTQPPTTHHKPPGTFQRAHTPSKRDNHLGA